MNKEFYILRYERTEYAKRIRKDYESKRIKERRCNMRKWGIRHDGLCNTLSTVQKDNYLLEVTYKDDKDMNKSGIVVLGNYSPSGHDASRIVDENGVAPTVKENHGTVTAVAREVSEIELIDDTNLGFNPTPKIYTEYAPTLRASRYGLKVKECDEMNNLKIRKLTPKECFRLMGFDDEDFYKAEAVNSNTQLYKQAGNSIVVDVLEAVFANLKPYLSEGSKK